MRTEKKRRVVDGEGGTSESPASEEKEEKGEKAGPHATVVGALDTPGEGQGGGCGPGGPGVTGFAQKGCPPRCGPPLLGRLCVTVPRSCAAAAGRGGGRGQTTPLPSTRAAAVSPLSQPAGHLSRFPILRQ